MSAAHAGLVSDGAQIERFVSSLLRHADDGTFTSLRAFDQFDRGKPPVLIDAVRVDDRRVVVSRAIAAATRAANAANAAVFAPPVATFRVSGSAKTCDLANGLSLAVELDAGNTAEKTRKLEAILGPATLFMKSGGECSDPETGEIFPKLHAHWRLSEPTRTAEDHAALQHARWLAATLVGGDMTAAPPVHPLRWPGSWNCKAEPKLATIAKENPDAEIHLSDALATLQDAVEAAGLASDTSGVKKSAAAPQAAVARVQAALSFIPNDGDWHDWNRTGMATWAATGGSAEGFLAFAEWSAKSPKHDEATTAARWKHYATSPPSRIGAGTLIHQAKIAGWDGKSVRPEADAGLPPPEGNDIPPPEGDAEKSTGETQKLIFIKPPALQGIEVKPREWIVQDWLPVGCATLNYGDGGTGKTLLSQQLMTSTACAKPWIGLAVMPCRSVGVFCEDDAAELHRRQDRINAAYCVDFRDLGDMAWASGVGQDNALMRFQNDGSPIKLPRIAEIQDFARKHRARLVVVDTAADAFGGNENDRTQVRNFMGAMNALALEIEGAVLINAHPSRSGLSATGDLDGGSTAWSNTARSRWSLTRPKADGDDGVDNDERLLTRRKANYASIGDTVKLRWCNGVLSTPNRPSGFSTMAAQADADALFLTLVARVEREGRHVSDTVTSSTYAPKQFARRSDRMGFSQREFEAAMQRLFVAGKIRVEEYGRAGGRGRPRHIVVAEGDNGA